VAEARGVEIVGEAAMLEAGAALAQVVRAGDIIALSGGLGAGKTTLARGLLSALGLAEEAPSPTFAIVQPYEPPLVRLPVAHVDLYRLDAPEEAEELGLDDYLHDGALVIEWPERLGDRLWPDALRIDIGVEADGARRLTAQVPEAWRERWPFPA
jgi:tRNA threonylcarbamoyladenosine biosynthesis protein TsaE